MGILSLGAPTALDHRQFLTPTPQNLLNFGRAPPLDFAQKMPFNV